MRPIKFRAWDSSDREMIVFDEGEGEGYEKLGQFFSDNFGCKMLQYTGLKDKNGKEIYEGDVVRSYNDYWDGCKSLDLICWWGDGEWSFGGHPWCEVGEEKCEVIGNIYEHPELLEKE